MSSPPWAPISSGSPALTQAIVGDFIQQGYFSRHIQRMRKLYAERRALTAAFMGGFAGALVYLMSQTLAVGPIIASAIAATVVGFEPKSGSTKPNASRKVRTKRAPHRSK